MKNKKINYLVVGIFVITMLAGGILAIAILAGRTGATDTYFTNYKNVAGLKLGTQVSFMGFPVGQVETIRPGFRDGNVEFQVEISVAKGWKIPASSRAVISSPGLLAAVAIDIRTHRGSAAPPGEHGFLQPGDTIEGQEAANVFSKVGNAAEALITLTETDVRPLIARLHQLIETDTVALIEQLHVVADSLGKLVDQDAAAMARQIRDIIDHIVQQTPGIMRNLEEFSQEINETNRMIQSMLGPGERDQVQEILANHRNASADLQQLAQALVVTGSRINNLVETIHGVATDNQVGLNQAIGDLGYTLQEVSQHIDAITFNIEGTARNMYEFSRQLRQNPGLLLGGKSPVDKSIPHESAEGNRR